MKKLTCLFLLACSMSAFSQDASNFGEKVDTAKAITVAQLQEKLASEGKTECVVKGQIKNVCQREGCWLNLENPDGEAILVRMKNHSFTVPKDIAGDIAILSGSAKMDTTSVDMLRHYADDDGKSAHEIAAITKPRIQIVMEADGATVVKQAGEKK